MSLKQNTTDLQAALAAITGLPDYIDPAKAPIPADAIAALTEKGVDVASGANVSTLAGLIAAIEAGGVKVTSGTFTLAEAPTAAYTLQHGLGVVPQFFILSVLKASPQFDRTLTRVIAAGFATSMLKTDDAHAQTGFTFKLSTYQANSASVAHYTNAHSLLLNSPDSDADFAYGANDNTLKIGRDNGSYTLQPAIKYGWIALG